MAEGYVVTSAVDANDLLNQIVSQAAIHGWTQLSLGGLGAIGRRAHLSRDGVVINLASACGPASYSSSTAAQEILNTIIPLADRYSTSGPNPGDGSWSWVYTTSSPITYIVPDVLCINVSTAYDPMVNWYRQPGAPFRNGLARLGDFQLIKSKGAIGRVHMFFYDNPAMIFVITEPESGVFQWLCAGNLAKDYSFSGGQLFGASMTEVAGIVSGSAYPGTLDNILVRIDAPDVVKITDLGTQWGSSKLAKPDRQLLPSSAEAAGQRVPQYFVAHSGATVTQFSDVIEEAYDEPTGRIWFNPIWAYAARPSNTRSYIGDLKHVHYTTVSRFPGGDLVTVGGVEYMIFPTNYRPSPYNPAVTTTGSAPWLRNAHYGSGVALRKPS